MNLRPLLTVVENLRDELLSVRRTRNIDGHLSGRICHGVRAAYFYYTTGGSYIETRFKPDSGTCKQFITNQTLPQYTTTGSFIKGAKSRQRLYDLVRRPPDLPRQFPCAHAQPGFAAGHRYQFSRGEDHCSTVA